MKTRLGIVFWWIGSLWLALWAGGGTIAVMFVTGSDRAAAFFGGWAFGAFGAALAWSLCFVVAGSFWRAPRAPT